MTMRVDCKHYDSRTYASGDVVRKCRLDLAPEAPWKCPDDCPLYERRLIDAGWHYGSLGRAVGSAPAPPPELGTEEAALLDAAEDIVNEAGRRLIEEDTARTERAARKRRLRRRKR